MSETTRDVPLLSEAIRIGAKMRPQTFRAWFSNGGSCAVAAACEAIGIARYPNCVFLAPAPQEWQWARTPAVCPECGDRRPDVSTAMIHLNNEHRWTREAIADWVGIVEWLPTREQLTRSAKAIASARAASDPSEPHP